MQRFGEKLRTLRTRHGLTVRELASALGYNAHNHISLVENGRREPSLRMAIKIAHFFHVTLDQLVNDNEEV